MVKEQILKYLKQPYDKFMVHLLDVDLMNDSTFYKNYFMPCVTYAKHRVKLGDYDSTLFIQCCYLSVNRFLANKVLMRDYTELQGRIDLPTKYQFAKFLAEYIESDYLN